MIVSFGFFGARSLFLCGFGDTHLCLSLTLLVPPAIFLPRPRPFSLPFSRVCAFAFLVRTIRSFTEILRVIDALQLAAKHPIATPVNWNVGQPVMIQPTVSDADAEAKFPGFKKIAVPSGKNFLRMTEVPADK